MRDINTQCSVNVLF